MQCNLLKNNSSCTLVRVVAGEASLTLIKFFWNGARKVQGTVSELRELSLSWAKMYSSGPLVCEC